MSYLSAQCPPDGGGLFVNEIKISGSDEFIELVVLGDPTNPTNPVDLTGWIVDDNNINMASQGTAMGHLKFGSFNNVSPGAIILIYNESDPYVPIPASNPPYLWVFKGSDMDGCSLSPSTSNSLYTPCGTAGGHWSFMSMPNAGDFPQVREPNSDYFHGLSYNNVTTLEAGVEVSSGNIGLDCGDWFDASNYTIITQTPGDFNSPDNQILIEAIRNPGFDCNNIEQACDPLACPEINAINPLIPVCENESFSVMAHDIANMATGLNGETDFGVNFVSFPGSVAPADPYFGGTSIGTVPFGSLGGVQPLLTADLTVPPGTFSVTPPNTSEIYTICAILDPVPATIVCDPSQCTTIEILSAPTVDLTGAEVLCPGDCYTLDLNITGGAPPFEVDFSLIINPFPNIDIPTPYTYDVNNPIIICYDSTIPSWDAATNTWHLSTLVTGSGNLEVINVNSANSCNPKFINNNVDITLLAAPDAYSTTADQCDNDGDGFATFDLTSLDVVINGGAGIQVIYYEDINLTVEILNPSSFSTSSTTIWATTISPNGCNSEPVPVDLFVLPQGNEGNVNIYCSTVGNKHCEFCSTETANILFDFPNTTGNYVVIVEYTSSSGGTLTFTANNVKSGDSFPFTITESTTFTFTSITLDGSCPDITDLGDDVVIDIIQGPEISNLQEQIACDSVILENIIGDNLSGNESYYTMPNGMGTAIAPGTVFTSSTTLYIYDEIGICNDEVVVLISVIDNIIFDPVIDVENCGDYTLPEITGQGITGQEKYYTGTNGSGISYQEGDIISSSIHLYIFDASVSCLEGEVDFDITISPGPTLYTPEDTLVCDIFILETIQGVNLNGTEFYNTLPNGLGDTLLVGDTISTEEKIFLYASESDDCIVQDSFLVSIGSPNNVGKDSTIAICEGDVNPVNLWALLGPDVDTAGVWTDFSIVGVDISDSTSVDFSTISIGLYKFTYQLLDTTCGVPVALVQVSIISKPNAGNSLNIILCETDTSAHNPEWEIGAHDSGGVWKQRPAGIFDLSDINNVHYTDATPGEYQLIYLVDIGAGCIADSAILNIIIHEAPDAGRDSSMIICMGTSVDLSFLAVDATSIGDFIDDDSSGGVSGNIFNSTGVSSGVYHFTHSLIANAPCVSDDAIYTIEVTNVLSAGNDNNTSSCVGEQIDLTSFLMGADSGGSFVDDDATGFLSGGTMVNINNANQSTIHFTYSIGGGGCPVSTSIITINIDEAPELSWAIDDNTLCEGECAELTVNFDGMAAFDFAINLKKNNTSLFDFVTHTSATEYKFNICNGNDIKINGDTIFISGVNDWHLEVTDFMDNNCVADVSNIPLIDIALVENEFINIDTTSCYPITIEGILFDENHTMDHFEVVDPLACKKIYNVVYHPVGPEFTYELYDPECPDDNGSINILSINGNPDDYEIVIDQVVSPINSLPLNIALLDGKHEVYIQDTDGCKSPIEEFVINEAEPFSFTATMDSINPTQIQFEGIIDITGDYTIIWTPEDSLSCRACLNPIINLASYPQTFTIQIRYSVSCTYEYTFTVPAIKVPPPEPEPINKIYIPTVFNPDESQFYISTTESLIIEKFKIFDRWGTLLFNGGSIETNTGIGWNGIHKGTKVQPGVFVYMIQLRLDNGELETRTGTLTLLR